MVKGFFGIIPLHGAPFTSTFQIALQFKMQLGIDTIETHITPVGVSQLIQFAFLFRDHSFRKTIMVTPSPKMLRVTRRRIIIDRYFDSVSRECSVAVGSRLMEGNGLSAERLCEVAAGVTALRDDVRRDQLRKLFTGTRHRKLPDKLMEHLRAA